MENVTKEQLTFQNVSSEVIDSKTNKITKMLLHKKAMKEREVFQNINNIFAPNKHLV